MRKLAPAFLTCVTFLLLVSSAAAQVPMRVKIDKVQVGFRPYGQDDFTGRFKIGLWTPVYVYFSQAPNGPIVLPAGKDGVGRGELLVETSDSDGVPNIYRVPLALAANEQRPRLTYTRPGAGRPEIKISVVAGGKAVTHKEEVGAIDLGEHLYLTLGARLNHFQEALMALAPGKDKDARETKPREAAYENDVERLPKDWFGYNAVDLMVLTTDNNIFLRNLLNERPRTRLKALAEWVRRGGRFVVGVAWRNQDKVHALLQAEAWQPRLPDILPPDGQTEISELGATRTWAQAFDKLFPGGGKDPVRVAKLNPDKRVDVLVAEGAGRDPVIVRMPYGLGSVTVVAFDLDKGPFSVWDGRVEFWQALLGRLAPRVIVPPEGPDGMRNAVFGDTGSDLTTGLQRELDKFDVAVISFGWVALFILLYILVVGPLDYLILKKVFKRLEWTWITFPSVVLLVSAIAYFTAYALKGNDLKINKVDLVDLDLRTDLDQEQRTQKAYAYGTTWFTVLSPRIQSYTLGIEPAVRNWAEGKGDSGLAGLEVTWLGRPEPFGMGGMGRQRSQGLFRHAYEYAPDAAGLLGVPIAVWSTKAFTASWEAPLDRLPFTADLRYQGGFQDPQLAGTIKNNLPVDLTDAWLYYAGKWYPFPSGLPGTGAGAPPVKVSLNQHRPIKMDEWVSARDTEGTGPQVFNPTQTIKKLLFLQSTDPTGLDLNHSQRRLDQSWRLGMEARQDWPGATREVILFGRLARARGSAERLTADGDPRLPTHLWLGEVPGEGKTRPPLPGTLVQDTYLRVYLPVTPQQP
jgi:hypothetical protein